MLRLCFGRWRFAEVGCLLMKILVTACQSPKRAGRRSRSTKLLGGSTLWTYSGTCKPTRVRTSDQVSGAARCRLKAAKGFKRRRHRKSSIALNPKRRRGLASCSWTSCCLSGRCCAPLGNSYGMARARFGLPFALSHLTSRCQQASAAYLRSSYWCWLFTTSHSMRRQGRPLSFHRFRALRPRRHHRPCRPRLGNGACAKRRETAADLTCSSVGT
mmetsp:Transcript_85611/g.247103  ORF Transcript_85611/g.247103 Transcript_85611/m.247103 type:complete len:215 (+) Transcript_85611:246-890(+)